MAESKDIVLVGGSIAGLNTAHYFLKKTWPSLKSSQPSENYRLVLIDQSSHFYWRIGAPRAMVSTTLMPHSKSFWSIEDSFKNYPKGSFLFHQGTASSIDTTNHTITFITPSGAEETISYFALILATGTSTRTPLTSLVGDYTVTKSALETMNKRLASAKEVVIAGGGPVGVETAGEIGEAFNGTASMFETRPEQKVKVTLVAGGKKLLPVLRQSLSDKAEKFLNRVAVDVIYNTPVEKVELSEADSDGLEAASKHGVTVTQTTNPKTNVHLSDGTILTADVYLSATGVTPNSSYIPEQMLNARGFVKTDKYLRVEGGGDRVYCIGDLANWARAGALNLYAAVPILFTNLAADLQKASGAGANVTEKEFKPDTSETQIVPVGRSKGVGAFNGWQTPSIAVWGIKGRDFMASMIPQTTMGTKW